MCDADMRLDNDIIIIGAGISGLYVGINVLKKWKNKKCIILEKYNYIGGRVVTYTKDISGVTKVRWENGAGRIAESHVMVRDLMKKYSLTFVPIDGSTDSAFTSEAARGAAGANRVADANGVVAAGANGVADANGVVANGIRENRFSELINIYLRPLLSLSSEELQNHSISELLHKIHGISVASEFYKEFPYYSEIHVLRADLALKSFFSEMNSNYGFGICKEGLTEIIKNMVKEFESLGGIIYKNTEVISVSSDSDNIVNIECITKKKLCDKKGLYDKEERLVFRAKCCVCALHVNAIRQIKNIKHINLLKHLKMMPLLRIYAVFPKGENNKVWFTNMHKIVTNEHVRYIIPSDYDKGIIMISYTDGTDADYWLKRSNNEKSVIKQIMKEIRKLFPNISIPEPIFYKFHPWYDGCTYWLPGNYDAAALSKEALNPLGREMPGLFMCGESFSLKQAWMEGALEHAQMLLSNKNFLSYNNLTK